MPPSISVQVRDDRGGQRIDRGLQERPDGQDTPNSWLVG